MKNKPTQPLCERGCSRPAFAYFATCCTKCSGPDGSHSKDCLTKAGSKTTELKKAGEELGEGLRQQLQDWHVAGAMNSPEEVNEVIDGLASSSAMDPQLVKLLWFSVARQTRPIKAPVSLYVSLAKKHHNIDVEVIDLGQYSQKHCNSCMFLTCSVALADRRLKGYADAELPGVLGSALESCGVFEQTSSVEELVAEHQRHRDSTLGRMADALRHAACELLLCDEAFYLPFFHPVHEVSGTISDAPSETERYRRWVEKLRGDEEGDELVILALAHLCGVAVQPVQQSGYRVPLMDPTGAESYKGCITYWGNDDRHWVWLRNLNE